jgi:glycerophosphoryl diester phosphodiesterase
MYNRQKTIPAALISILLCIFLVPGIHGHAQTHYLEVKTTTGLHQLLRHTGEKAPFLMAHRGGAAEGYPENCMETFAYTLSHCRAVIEVDPRYTKDSVVVLHHDATLERTTTGYGKVSDHTWEELKELRLKDLHGNVTRFRIPTLDEALTWAKGKTILWLDKKDVPVEERIRMVEMHQAESYVVILAYSFEEARQAYLLNQNIVVQVFLSNTGQVKEFENYGVPWSNVVAFIGHKWPDDPELFTLLHKKEVMCIVGTGRNLDLEYLTGKVPEIGDLKVKYDELFEMGTDMLETDIPVPLSKIYPRFSDH